MRVTRALYDEVVRQREVLERRCEGHDGLVALLRARIDDLERTLQLVQRGRYPPARQSPLHGKQRATRSKSARRTTRATVGESSPSSDRIAAAYQTALDIRKERMADAPMAPSPYRKPRSGWERLCAWWHS